MRWRWKQNCNHCKITNKTVSCAYQMIKEDLMEMACQLTMANGKFLKPAVILLSNTTLGV